MVATQLAANDATTGLRGLAGTIWITWEPQRRNREVAAALGVPLVELSELPDDNRLLRYGRGLWRTALLLRREAPRLVIGQNPSLVLAAVLLIARRFHGFRVVIDAHNGGLFPLEGRSRFLVAVSRWVQRRADLTIVTNHGLEEVVKLNGGRPFVLPDKIPELRSTERQSLPGRFNVMFVCSFSADEPFQEVFEASSALPADIVVHVTGKYERSGIEPARFDPRLHFTGFLPEADYLRLLNSADVVMDLTTRENCLVCGAYEAAAALRPMILSDTQANREYFDRGAVYARHDPPSLAAAILSARERKTELERDVAEWKRRRSCEWREQSQALRAALGELVRQD